MRCGRTAWLWDELLDGEIFYSLREAKIVIESWRRRYNTVRPHGSLGYKPPAPEIFVPAMTSPDGPSMGLGVVAGQGILAGEQPQPPGAALVADGTRVPDQVALAHDADHCPACIHDGHATDAALVGEGGRPEAPGSRAKRTTVVVMTSAAVSMGQILGGGERGSVAGDRNSVLGRRRLLAGGVELLEVGD